MKEDKFEKLVEKYKEGNSTLNEENFLFNNAKTSAPLLETWATFVRNNKTETPKDFNDTLWESFQNKKARKRRKFIRTLSVAASVILIIAFFISSQGQKEQSYSEKERLLSQAMNMFDGLEQKEIQHHIFYENDMIVLYTTNE